MRNTTSSGAVSAFATLFLLTLALLTLTPRVAWAGSPSDAVVSRGDYLVNVVAQCGSCHTPRILGQPDTSHYLGGVECFLKGKLPDGSNPPSGPPADAGSGPWCGAGGCEPDYTKYGCFNVRNLSNHETGLKSYTDIQIKNMIQVGRRPNGDALNPVMPYWTYQSFTDDDVAAIIAYLRTVPGVNQAIPANDWPWVVEQPTKAIDTEKVWRPAPGAPGYDSMMRGRYLATVACMDCHSPRRTFPGRETDFEAPIDQNLLFAGTGRIGFWFHELNQIPSPPFPWRIYSSNLTSDETGIKGYTVPQFTKAVSFGIGRDGTKTCVPMPAGRSHGQGFGYLTNDDLHDLANYFLAMPPIFQTNPTDCRANGAPPRQKSGASMTAGHGINPVRGLSLLGAFALSITAFVAVRRQRARAIPPGGRPLAAFVAGFLVVVFHIVVQLLERRIELYDAAISLGAALLLDGPKVQSFLAAMTVVGSAPVVVLVGVLVAAGAWLRGERRAAVVLAAVVVSSEVLNLCFKLGTERTHLGFLTELADLHRYTFPSGHALASAAIYGSSGMVAARLFPKASRALKIATFFLVFAVGLSRLALSDQWLSDVVVGFAIGLLLCTATAVALDPKPAAD